jgi:hypothetical protein
MSPRALAEKVAIMPISCATPCRVDREHRATIGAGFATEWHVDNRDRFIRSGNEFFFARLNPEDPQENIMQGKKTHKEQVRILEGNPDERRPADPAAKVARQDIRETEFPVSRGGLNQENRDHNKHNREGQGGHKPQQHSPAEEKH